MRAHTTQPITRLKLGTNTARALVVKDRSVAAVAPDGLSIDARYGASLTATVIGDTAYILGTVSVDEVDIRIDTRRDDCGCRHADRAKLDFPHLISSERTGCMQSSRAAPVSTWLLGPPRYVAGAGSDFSHLTSGYRYAKSLDAITNRWPAKGILICPAMQMGKVELRFRRYH